MIGWEEYSSALSPISREDDFVASWGGRPVVNWIAGDLQLPPAQANPRYERSERGPAANRGLSVRDGFANSVVLPEIARRWGGLRHPGAFSRVS